MNDREKVKLLRTCIMKLFKGRSTEYFLTRESSLEEKKSLERNLEEI